MIDISYLSIPLFMVSGLPQTIRLIQRKQSGDVSVLTYCMTWLGIFFIVLSAEGGILWANITSGTILTINLILILKYRFTNP